MRMCVCMCVCVYLSLNGFFLRNTVLRRVKDGSSLVETGTRDHGFGLSHTQNILLQLTPWEMD